MKKNIQKAQKNMSELKYTVTDMVTIVTLHFESKFNGENI